MASGRQGPTVRFWPCWALVSPCEHQEWTKILGLGSQLETTCTL